MFGDDRFKDKDKDEGGEDSSDSGSSANNPLPRNFAEAFEFEDRRNAEKLLTFVPPDKKLADILLSETDYALLVQAFRDPQTFGPDKIAALLDYIKIPDEILRTNGEHGRLQHSPSFIHTLAGGELSVAATILVHSWFDLNAGHKDNPCNRLVFETGIMIHGVIVNSSAMVIDSKLIEDLKENAFSANNFDVHSGRVLEIGLPPKTSLALRDELFKTGSELEIAAVGRGMNNMRPISQDVPLGKLDRRQEHALSSQAGSTSVVVSPFGETGVILENKGPGFVALRYFAQN